MTLIKLKPTSPGTRFQVRISRQHLHKGDPYAPLTVAQSKTGARNQSLRAHHHASHRWRVAPEVSPDRFPPR
jgi:ribosomal protein L2